MLDQASECGMTAIFQTLLLARWIHFAAVFVLFGSAFFWFYADDRRGSDDWAARATVLLLRAAAPVAAISGVAWLAGILANMTSGFGAVLDAPTLRLFFLETQFGPVAIFRLVLLAAAVGLGFSPWRGRGWLAGFALIGALLLIDQAWLGHAAEGGAGLYGGAMLLVYSVHVLAAAAWVGGLPPLLFVLIEQSRAAPDAARLWATCARFSAMGMVAVALAVASGVANAGFRVGGSFERLLGADYGDVVLTKAALVAAMLALAGFNRFVAMPRLGGSGKGGNVARLNASVAVELVLGVLVIAAAAALGLTPPPQ